MQRRFKAVTFDVGGTLIAPWPSVGHVYAEAASRHGWTGLDPASLNRQFAAAWKTLKHFTHTRAQWAALVEDSFHGLIPASASAQFFPELYDRFASPEVWRVFDDVEPVLVALKAQGMRLGIISNWDERLRPLLAGLKLSGAFDVFAISVEIGATKPHPRIFEQACRDLGLEAAAVLHVGDSVVMDLEGATSAGIKGVLLDRSGRGGPGTVTSLAEVLGFL